MRKTRFRRCLNKRVIALIIFSIIFISGCSRLKISSDNAPYYAEATSSLLWCRGNSNTAHLLYSPEINIIEEDQYGRVLFEYSEGVGSVQCGKAGPIIFYMLSAVLVAQKSDEKCVYFYPNVNYKCRIIDDSTMKPVELTAEELSELKTLNDWNKELDLSRCQKEQNIYDIRDNKRHNIEATDQIRTVKAEFETQYSVELKAFPFEQNDSGSVIVSMCEFGDQPWNGCLLIVMINADGSYAFKDNASGDLDYFNYQDALMQLKEECNWDR